MLAAYDARMGFRFATLAALGVLLAALAGAASPLLQMRVPSVPVSVRYRSGSERALAEVARTAEMSARELARSFGLDSLPPLTLQLERTSGDFEQATGGRAPDWGAAIAFPRQRLAIFDLAACARHPQGLSAVVRHELSHLLFHEASGGLPVPTWFAEGVALIQASEWDLGDSWTLLEGRLRGELPGLDELDGGFPRRGDDAEVAYRISMRAVNGLLKSSQPDALAELARRCRTADTFEEAFEATFGIALESYAYRFSREIDRTYRWATILSSVPVLFGFMSVLFLLAYGAKKLRARRTLRRWAEEDRAHPAPVIPFPAHRIQGGAPPETRPEETPPEAAPPETSQH